ncbi:MAG: hypothetical protein EVB11_01120 [Winogradskyella sp.]|nr:MAG: hypothetical protein EVB11_01120 [Winogradskyella sp.]
METVKQKSWFSRNWGWVLGGGCLTIIIVVVLGIGGIIYKVSDAVTNSEPYTYALTKAIENKKVINFLGEPIETNGMGSTNYNYKNGTTTTSLTIPIRGPKDEGSIVVNAEKISDEWSYHDLYVKIDGETEAIDLKEVKDE